MAVTIKGKTLAVKPQKQTPEPQKEPVKVKRSRKKITNVGYSADTYARLFEFVAAGDDLSKACRHAGMPHPATVRRRMLVDDQLADQFKTSQIIRLHGLADTLVSLPDEAIAGYEKVTAADRLTAAKQKADNIKWVLQRGLAEYAGAGEEGGNVTVNLINSPDAAVAAGAAPFVPAGQPVLKIVGGAQSTVQPADSKDAGNG